MKAKLKTAGLSDPVRFGDLDHGDWFLDDGKVSQKIEDSDIEYNTLEFQEDKGFLLLQTGDDAMVTPIQVTISY